MYDRFVELLQKHGVKPANVARETGISQTVFSEWKSGKSTPKQDKLKKIADYFGVSVDYLMTGEEPESRAPVSDEELRLALFGGAEEVTDEMWEEAVDFARFIVEREKKKRRDKE